MPIPPEAAKDILAGANKGTAYLFYDPAGRSKVNFARERGREISAAFTAARIHCGGHMVSHRLRDTFAVDLLGKGESMELVSRLLGHKSIATTQKHYAPWNKAQQDTTNARVRATWAVTKKAQRARRPRK